MKEQKVLEMKELVIVKLQCVNKIGDMDNRFRLKAIPVINVFQSPQYYT